MEPTIGQSRSGIHEDSKRKDSCRCDFYQIVHVILFFHTHVPLCGSGGDTFGKSRNFSEGMDISRYQKKECGFEGKFHHVIL